MFNLSNSVTNNNLKGNVSALTPLAVTGANSEASNDIIRDCNLCQVTQVNIQQHAFTVEHIRKVKDLLAQTSAAAAASIFQGGEEDVKCSLNDYMDQKTLPPNGEQNQQNVQQQQQLALMMMAFQTQNMPNSLMAFNALEDNSAECVATDELSENSFSTKLIPKNQKKTKRNAIKKKKFTMKKSNPAENLATDNELFFNLNANTAVTAHLNAATGSMVDNYKHVNISLDSNEENDGNNNHEDVEMTEDDEQVIEVKSGNEPINEANDITKSQMYKYNHIAVMEGK
ncbi:uncharacterized protein LOC124420295 [Lucilia cuprina]|uniref:uncharacterized protein LOC124420295 n=1 Tax=Lucilia cuprina TaxID=7375 RepID=UPI001F05AF7E|nr:uncharacterized protein LOC124420295 [Lucilia cuprina]